jgi:hypothetical protein
MMAQLERAVGELERALIHWRAGCDAFDAELVRAAGARALATWSEAVACADALGPIADDTITIARHLVGQFGLGHDRGAVDPLPFLTDAIARTVPTIEAAARALRSEKRLRTTRRR